MTKEGKVKFQMAFFKGNHPGLAGVYSRGVRWWCRGPYSHVEIIFSDGLSASASYLDGGVRFKQVDYSAAGDWDFIDLPPEWEAAARLYFKVHEGEAYDLLGNLHFVISAVPDARSKKFCSEACGGAVGVEQSWRYDPNALYPVIKRLVEAQTVAAFPEAA